MHLYAVQRTFGALLKGFIVSRVGGLGAIKAHALHSKPRLDHSKVIGIDLSLEPCVVEGAKCSLGELRFLNLQDNLTIDLCVGASWHTCSALN